MKYKEIREHYQRHDYLNLVFVDFYAMCFSPFLTNIFIKLNIIPNYVTILMMISGIIGALLFSLPNIFLKVIGIIFIHLWYILDCSDGEVARATKKFSKFGKEIDYTAHIINHPLFNIAFATSMIYLNRYDSKVILILFMIFISCDLLSRNLLSLYAIYESKETTAHGQDTPMPIVKRIIIFAIDALILYPNFALIFPLFYIIDFYFKTNICFIYLILITFLSLIINARACKNWVSKIKNI